MSKLNPKTTKEHLIHLYDKIDNIENNHLFHIKKDIDKINYVIWAIGFMVATQFIGLALRFFT